MFHLFSITIIITNIYLAPTMSQCFFKPPHRIMLPNNNAHEQDEALKTA